MRKLIITEFMSLDGVFQAPGPDGSGYKYEGWTFPFNSEEFGKFKYDELQQTDMLLLGRVTYEGFAKAWPSQKDPAGFADKFNSMPKYVVSKSLTKAEWNNSHIITDNIVEEIQKLKNQDGGDIVVHGSGTLARFLIEQNLVDEITILLYPVVLGTGKQLFADIHKTGLKLIETTSFATGVVVLRYKPEEVKENK
jgi:dihydrofolate reductase